MIFTTKAEYGVRLLVELGLPGRATQPVSLKAIAEAEGLPLAYLERIVALLKKAGLVEATRGAHGGYLLARARRGDHDGRGRPRARGRASRRWTASSTTATGRVLCSHARRRAAGCATKLLWTRVQGGVIKSLQRTTLAELVDFSAAATRPPATRPTDTSTLETMADLEIRNLHVQPATSRSSRASTCTSAPARSTR